MGKYSYLNYLKNNLGVVLNPDELIVEDKFGNKTAHDLSDFPD